MIARSAALAFEVWMASVAWRKTVPGINIAGLYCKSLLDFALSA